VLFDLDDTLWAIEPVLVRAEGLLYDWLRQHARAWPPPIRSPACANAHGPDEDRSHRIDLWKLRHTALSRCLPRA
jgi:putative hydrolase of the HAD superfamily